MNSSWEEVQEGFAEAAPCKLDDEGQVGMAEYAACFPSSVFLLFLLIIEIPLPVNCFPWLESGHGVGGRVWAMKGWQSNKTEGTWVPGRPWRAQLPHAPWITCLSSNHCMRET